MSKSKKSTIAYFIVILSSILGIVCTIYILPLFINYGNGIVFVSSAVYILHASLCPYCGKYRVIINPFSHKRFRCKNCGKEQPE